MYVLQYASGIGHISTRWVGERGKEELVSEMKELKYRQELIELKAQICQLATECKKALQATSCTEPQILDAINLCNNYLPKDKDSDKKAQNDPLKSLWDTTNSTVVDPTSILGQDLVDIITEKRKQPPDVCKSATYCLLFYLYCIM